MFSKRTAAVWSIHRWSSSGSSNWGAVKGSIWCSLRLRGFLVVFPLLYIILFRLLFSKGSLKKKKKRRDTKHFCFLSIICQQPSFTQRWVHRLQVWVGCSACCARERGVSSLRYPAVQPWKCQILQPNFTDKFYIPSSLWHYWKHRKGWSDFYAASWNCMPSETFKIKNGGKMTYFLTYRKPQNHAVRILTMKFWQFTCTLSLYKSRFLHFSERQLFLVSL